MKQGAAAGSSRKGRERSGASRGAAGWAAGLLAGLPTLLRHQSIKDRSAPEGMACCGLLWLACCGASCAARPCHRGRRLSGAPSWLPLLPGPAAQGHTRAGVHVTS